MYPLQVPSGAAQEEEGGSERHHGAGGDQRGGHAAGAGQVRWAHGLQAPLLQEAQEREQARPFFKKDQILNHLKLFLIAKQVCFGQFLVS